MRLLKIIAIGLVLVCSIDSLGQKIVFLNSSFEKVPKRKATHVARISRQHRDSLYDVDVRSYPDRKRYAKHKSRKKSALVRYAEGPVTIYYPDGVVKNISVFSDGEILSQVKYFPSGSIKNETFYRNQKKDGRFLEFNMYGDTSCVSYYTNDTLNGPYRLFFLNNKVSSVRYFKMGKKHGASLSYYAADSLDNSGNYDSDKRTGIWNYYHKNGQLASKEEYREDKIISAELFDEAGIPCPLPDSLHWLDKPPVYIGGERALLKDLSANMEYPVEALESNIQGTVYVELEINMSGKVVSKKILGNPHQVLSKPALDAIDKLKLFDPGLNHNRKHPVTLVIPIKFTLK